MDELPFNIDFDLSLSASLLFSGRQEPSAIKDRVHMEARGG